MERTVGAFEARRRFGKILEEVVAKGERYVVERHGEPVAAVVPMSVYQAWKRDREAFFDTIRRAQKRADMSPEEADALAADAVQTARAGK